MDRFRENLPVAITAGHQIPIFYTHPATTAVTKATVIGVFRTEDKIEE